MEGDSDTGESVSIMTGKDTPERKSTHRITDAYIGFPICEFCGHIVFPGEEQKLDRGSLAWHKAHCFRCYGCHREFLEERTCHLLPNLALCDDCYPRHQFYVDEWKSQNEGEDLSIKQPRVCFLSPVTNSASTENHSSPDIRDSGNGDSTQHENGFESVPRQLAFGQIETPRLDRIQPREHRSMFPSSVSTPMSSAALVDASSVNLRERTETAQLVTQARTATMSQSTDKTVEALIADAMQTAEWVPRVLSPIETEVPVEAAAGGKTMEKTKSVEELVIDEKYSVLAVNNWTDVASKPGTESEYVKWSAVSDGEENCAPQGPPRGPPKGPPQGPLQGPPQGPPRGPSKGPLQGPPQGPPRGPPQGPSRGLPQGPSITTRSDESVPLIENVWRQSCRTLRRTSSCSEVYLLQTAADALSDIRQGLSDSISNSDGTDFRSFQCSEEDEEDLRDADFRASPSPVQSSTPIPQVACAFPCNERPPSSFREDLPSRPRNPLSSRTMSPEDVSPGTDDGVGEKSFQELRAIFEKSNDVKKVKTCCVCGAEVLPSERFECLYKVYHQRCFQCSKCKSRLNVQTFRDDGRQPYCKYCFLEVRPVMRPRMNSL